MMIFSKNFQDPDMERGKPLYLNEERYAVLAHMVRTSFAIVCLIV